MGYLDIVKRGVGVANRNILAIGIQLLFLIIMLAFLVVLLLVILGMFVGSFAALGNVAQSPDKLMDVIGSSFSAIFMGVLAGFLFLIIAGIMNAYVQSGIIGCVIASAKDDSVSFSMPEFTRSAWASGIHFFWLQLTLFLTGLCGFIVLGTVGVIGVAAVLLPLKDSGNMVAAFALGVPFITVLILVLLVFVFLLYGAGRVAQVSLVDGRRGAFSAIGSAYEFIKARFWDVMLFTLMIAFMLLCANVVIELMTLPMNLLSEKNPLVVLWFLPVLFLAMLLRMYVTLVGQSCYAVYYLSEVAPPPAAPVEPQGSAGDLIDDAEIAQDDPSGPAGLS